MEPQGELTLRYLAFIHKADDSPYGISFPDFPGCISTGDTLDEAVEQGTQALALHAEGLLEDGDPLPEPRSFEEISRDPIFTESRHRAQLAWVPLILEQDVAEHIQVAIDGGLLTAIDEEVRRLGTTRSSFLARAARHELQAT